ncbi:MAG TPA: FRG domain-containing protein [Candidatus Methanoperedens sp.]
MCYYEYERQSPEVIMQLIREVYTHYPEKLSDSEKNLNLPNGIEYISAARIRESSGFKVKTYRKLVKCVAELGYLNPHFNLLYRGQDKDYKNKNGSIIYPSIFRPTDGKRITTTEIEKRFSRLDKIRMKLRSNKKNISLQKRLLSYPEYYYALIQHYQKNETPLIDLTQSLRVAATFALLNSTTGYVLVFGMPHPHGSISHFIDQEMVLVKLQNVCPPNAFRPHYQEGYLVGNLPFNSMLPRFGDNLARRLIGKYYLDNSDDYFWDKGFSSIPKEVLFPKNDPFQEELNDILEKELSNSRIATASKTLPSELNLGKISKKSAKLLEAP